MGNILFSIESLQSGKYKNYAKQIDNQSSGKFKDNNIDSEEIKKMTPFLISEFSSIKQDKRIASMGSEFAKELDDLMLIFNSLPNELKKVVRDKVNENKKDLSKIEEQKLQEMEKELEEQCIKLKLQLEAQRCGVELTEEDLSQSPEKIKLIIEFKKSQNSLIQNEIIKSLKGMF